MIKVKHQTLLPLIFLLFITCKDNEDKIRFEGIILKDTSNQPLGTKGSRDLDDWGMDSRLPDKIMDLMEEGVEHDLSNTDYAFVDIHAYPNPCVNSGTVMFQLDGGPSEIKLLVVDENFNVLYRVSSVAGTTSFMFDFSNTDKFPDNSIVRVYYSLSQKEEKNYYVGHGDIWICRSGNCL